MNTSAVIDVMHVILLAISAAQMENPVIQNVIAPVVLVAAVHLNTHVRPAGAVLNFRLLISINQKDFVRVRMATLENQISVRSLVLLVVMYAMRNIVICACTARRAMSWRIQMLYQERVSNARMKESIQMDHHCVISRVLVDLCQNVPV